MRLLADENLPRTIVEELRSSGHDVLWARTHHPGVTDVELLNLAEAEGRILFTLDRDFWQIALQRRFRSSESGVVLFRIHPATPAEIGRFVRACVESDRPWKGHASMVSREGIHQVPLKPV